MFQILRQRFRLLLTIGVLLKPVTILIILQHRHPRRLHLPLINHIKIHSPEPFMCLYLLPIILTPQSILNLRIQQLPYQILCPQTKEPRKLYYPRANLLINSYRLTVIKRRIPCLHFKQQYTQRPPVHTFAVTSFLAPFNNFRR